MIVVGNFDGVHVGHRALFAEARRLADARGGEVVAVTFDRHPIAVLRPGQEPPMLMRVDRRAEVLAEAGADRVEWLSPDEAMLSQEPESFVRGLVEQLQPIAFVEGRSFRFGKSRRGGPDELRGYGEAMGFAAHILDLQMVTLRDKTLAPVSSTFVRWLVGWGRMSDAAICLGRPWELVGRVVEGERRGRELGVPTANLEMSGMMLPADGVYAGEVDVDGRTYVAAISVGRKPTFEHKGRLAEVHLLDFDGDLYGRVLRVNVLRWVREQLAFAGVGALRRQLAYDLETIGGLAGAGLLDPTERMVS